MYTPHDLCLDARGNLYFSQLGARGPDEGPEFIYRIDAETGILTIVAGSGKKGRGGEGRPALEAEFDTTTGVAVDADGNIFICDRMASTARVVDAKTGILSKYLGLEAGFKHPEHLALDSADNLYVCDNGNNCIHRIDRKTGIISTVLGTGANTSSGDGRPAREASTGIPDALFIDKLDNLYVGEVGGCRVRKVDAKTGIVTTLAGTDVPGFGEEGLPGPQTRCDPIESGLWADPDGTVIFSDSSGRLRRIDAETGIVTTIAGGTSIHDGGAATQAFIGCPRGICSGLDGTIYIADMQQDRIRAIDPSTGVIRTVAGGGGRGFGGDGGPATSARFLNPYGVTVDPVGRVVIADTLNNRVRRVEANGIINTIAGNGEASDRGDGGYARNAAVHSPHAVACRQNGDILIGDSTGRIRLIDREERIRTVVGTGIQGWTGDGGLATSARIGTPAAISFDASGTLYFADLTHHAIRAVSQGGIMSTIAGSGKEGFSPDGTLAKEARLSRPYGLAVRPSGTIYFSDARNNRVRKIDGDGCLETVAGSDGGDSGDGGAATRAQLNEPHGLCFYGDDLLLISDHYNSRIRAVRLNKGQ